MIRTPNNRIVGALALIILIGALCAAWAYRASAVPYPELSYIERSIKDQRALQTYLVGIAQEKGALYAYDLLRKAVLPPGTDVHLLGHAIGDELYKQYGKDAIAHCTDEFRNACPHTVVVGLLLDHGEAALSDIAASCEKAPGGLGAYSMCFHGLGHGVLAYTGYDLEATIPLCKKAADAGKRSADAYPQCVGGAVMETIAGGGHDREAWERMRTRFLSTTDPLSPCNAAFMPEEARGYCYAYLTPHLIQLAGTSMAHPDPDAFPKAFSFCSALPEGTPNRITCARSFGKEFIGFARTSDPRDISTLTDEEIARVRGWCASAEGKDAEYCRQGALQFVYWGGENDPRVSVRFCSTLAGMSDDEGAACFSYLSGLIGYFTPQDQHEAACAILPEQYRSACLSSPTRL